jgi:DNA-binding response OmpR family regulator
MQKPSVPSWTGQLELREHRGGTRMSTRERGNVAVHGDEPKEMHMKRMIQEQDKSEPRPIVVVGSENAVTRCIRTLNRHNLNAIRVSLEQLKDIARAAVLGVVTCERADSAIQALGMCRSETDLPLLLVTRPELKPHVATHAFACGADDCLTIPFDEHEFVARVRALSTAVRMLRPASCENDLLTRTERAILACLRGTPGVWLSAEQIIESALGTKHTCDTALVRVHIHNMRPKLARMRLQVSSRRGLGYRLEPVA